MLDKSVKLNPELNVDKKLIYLDRMVELATHPVIDEWNSITNIGAHKYYYGDMSRKKLKRYVTAINLTKIRLMRFKEEDIVKAAHMAISGYLWNWFCHIDPNYNEKDKSTYPPFYHIRTSWEEQQSKLKPPDSSVWAFPY